MSLLLCVVMSLSIAQQSSEAIISQLASTDASRVNSAIDSAFVFLQTSDNSRLWGVLISLSETDQYKRKILEDLQTFVADGHTVPNAIQTQLRERFVDDPSISNAQIVPILALLRTPSSHTALSSELGRAQLNPVMRSQILDGFRASESGRREAASAIAMRALVSQTVGLDNAIATAMRLIEAYVDIGHPCVEDALTILSAHPLDRISSIAVETMLSEGMLATPEDQINLDIDVLCLDGDALANLSSEKILRWPEQIRTAIQKAVLDALLRRARGDGEPLAPLTDWPTWREEFWFQQRRVSYADYHGY